MQKFIKHLVVNVSIKAQDEKGVTLWN